MNREILISWNKSRPWQCGPYVGECTPHVFPDYNRSSRHAGRYLIHATWYPRDGTLCWPPVARLFYYNEFSEFEADLVSGDFMRRPGPWLPALFIESTIVDWQAELKHIVDGEQLPRASRAEIIAS